MTINRSQPSNIAGVLITVIAEKEPHRKDEKCPYTDKIKRKRGVEDFEKRPIKKKRSEKKKKEP